MQPRYGREGFARDGFDRQPMARLCPSPGTLLAARESASADPAIFDHHLARLRVDSEGFPVAFRVGLPHRSALACLQLMTTTATPLNRRSLQIQAPVRFRPT